MMNPLHIQPRTPSETDSSAAGAPEAPRVKQTGFKGWLNRHFGAEPPQHHSPNFFISDVTEGGIGSHHRHQVFRPDKRH